MSMRRALDEYPMPPGLELPKPEALMSLLSQVEPIGLPWTDFAKALVTKGRLPSSWRELVILRVSWRRRCPYALQAHRVIGRHYGLSEERIALATEEGGYRVMSRVDRVLILATDELLDEGRIATSTKMVLQRFLDERAIIELTMLVGEYVLLGMVCETFQLVPEPSIIPRTANLRPAARWSDCGPEGSVTQSTDDSSGRP
jgi:4-carboxymuconolactone decarboxylase